MSGRAPLRLGLLATHPVQYQVPWYRALAAAPEVDLTVFYALLPTPSQQGVGFGVEFEWDVPLLDGYRHELLPNVAHPPSLRRFGGCDTPAVRDILHARRFDAFIVTGWGARSCLQALWACRRNGVPCLVRGESNALRRRPWRVRLLHRLLLRQFAACLTIGRANADFYRAAGVPGERLFAAPYCVDNARFGEQADALRRRRAELRAALGVPQGARTFLFCAKFVAKKRPLDLIDALALARRADRGERLHLLMVGDGELRAACEARAAALGLPASFAGFLNQSRVAEAYVAADCLVLPSDAGETWGLVVNEAMACGRPALVSDRVGCHPDLVLPGRTGDLFPCGDVAALAERLLHWGADEARLDARGREARGHVAAYSVQALVSGTLAALRYVTSGTEAGAAISSLGRRC